MTGQRGIQGGSNNFYQQDIDTTKVPLFPALLQSPGTIGLLQQIGDIMENQLEARNTEH